MTFAELTAKVLHDLPGFCPPGPLTKAGREAARDFCRLSEAFEADITVSIVADEDEYDLTSELQTGFWVRRIELVKINDAEISSTQYEFNTSTNVLTLDWEPGENDTDAMVVTVIYIPNSDYSVELPNDFTEKWWQYLVAGTKSILMFQPNREWSDPQRAALERNEFFTGIALARRNKYMKNKTGVLMVKPRPWR